MQYSSIHVHVENWRFVALFLNGLLSQVAHCCSEQIRSSWRFDYFQSYYSIFAFIYLCTTLCFMNDHHTPPFSQIFKYGKQKKCLFHPVTCKQMTGFTSNNQILHMKDIFIRKNDKLYLFIIFFIKKQKEYWKAIKEKNQNRVA